MLLTPRQSETGVANLLLSPRQAETSFTSFLSPRQSETGLSRDLLSTRQAETSLFAEDFYAIATSPSYTEWIAAFRQEYVVPRPSLTYAGLDLSPLLGDVSFDIPLNGKSTCSFTLGNPSTNGVVSFPSPTCPPGTGDYDGLIRQHDGTATRQFVFSLTYAGQPCTSSPYVPNIPSHGGPFLSWGGDDLTSILEQVPDTPLDDILLSDGDYWMAHEAAKRIATAAGIQVICNYPNYLVGELRAAAMSPLAALDALAKPMQAGRCWVNGTLVYAQVDTNAPAMWRFVDRLNIEDFQVSEYPRAYNYFKVARLSPAGGQIASSSGRTVGRNSVTFPASRSIYVETIRVVGGGLVDWSFFGESGNLLSGGSGAIEAYSGLPCTRADFTYRPNFTTVAFDPYYEIVVRGEPRPRDTSYTAEATGSAHQAVYGVNKASAISDPIIADQDGAQKCADAYLAEATRKVYKGALRTPYLNPFVQPGQVIEVTDRDCNQSSTRWVVEKVTLSWSGAKTAMELELSRGL